MGVNHYFQNYSSVKSNEQKLYEDLLVESISIMGHNCFYLPRESWDETDKIFGENVASRFDRAFQMEMYIKNTRGWEGDQEFFGKFGLDIRQNCNFFVAKKTFNKYVPTNIAARPREGDLVYVPVMSAIFEVNFVEEESIFFTRGQKLPYIYELRCVDFRGGNEKINTGIKEIDAIDLNTSYQVVMIMNGSGNYQIGETVIQGNTLSTATASGRVSDWTPSTRTLKVSSVVGDFTYSANSIGLISGTRATANSIDMMLNDAYYDFSNNRDIQTEANTFVNRNETNPFGSAW